MNITIARLRSNVKYNGPLETVLDSFFDQLLAPIRNMIPTLRIGMAGLGLSPIILILGLNYLVLPILSRMVC